VTIKSLTEKTAELMEMDETDAAGTSKSLKDRVVALSCINCVLKHKLTREEYGAPIDVCTCICHSPLNDRLLIFSTGTHTFTPHQVGFKLVRGTEVSAFKPSNRDYQGLDSKSFGCRIGHVSFIKTPY
jgi:hypothetical protein